MRFKIDGASLIVGSKFTVFALFYCVFEGNLPSTSSRGAYIWRGNLTEGFLCYRFGGLIFGGAYTWRGLFSEFYSIPLRSMQQEIQNQLMPKHHKSRQHGNEIWLVAFFWKNYAAKGSASS